MTLAAPAQPIRAEPTASAPKPRQRKSAAEWSVIAPGEHGWQLWTGKGNLTQQAQTLADMDAVLSTLGDKTELVLLLPLRCLLLQHLQLPSLDREEIQSMAELQVEKAILAEETGQFACEILEQREGQSSVLCAILREGKVDEFYHPLLDAGRSARRVHLQVECLAKQLPADRRHLLLCREREDLILALVGSGRLEYAEILDTSSTGQIDGDAINQALWRAELNGLSTSFDDILLGPGCAGWQQALADYFQCPVGELTPTWQPGLNLMDFKPKSWKAREVRRKQWATTQRWLILGTLIYALFVASAYAWIFHLTQKVDQQAGVNAKLEAQLIEQEEYNARWSAWRGALDPTASAIEILTLAHGALPNENTKMIRFLVKDDEILIEGEATNLAEANQAARNLKKTFAERGYNVSSDLPTALRNDRYHFLTRAMPFVDSPPSPTP